VPPPLSVPISAASLLTKNQTGNISGTRRSGADIRNSISNMSLSTKARKRKTDFLASNAKGISDIGWSFHLFKTESNPFARPGVRRSTFRLPRYWYGVCGCWHGSRLCMTKHKNSRQTESNRRQ
jgi:hypothetical protein